MAHHSLLGYQWLKQHFSLEFFPLSRVAKVAPVSRVTQTADSFLIPAHVAPKTDTPLEHLLFALKHEGVDLALLCQVLKRLPADDLLQAIKEKPSSRYLRVLGFLWEGFNQTQLTETLNIAGPTLDVFDPKRYITSAGVRDARWRVNFNGLGSLDYCVTVRRIPEIEDLLQQQLLQKANTFAQGLDSRLLERALSWAYLHETESSFAIEQEKPTADKAQAFADLLKYVHHPREMDEDYLVELQNLAINNPFDKAAAYRHQQNWLRGPLRGAAGVTYVPPMPESVDSLMAGVLSFANQSPKLIDPLVAASIVSFAFVFVHPFMDGNGRLSRFLFHYALAQSGQLTPGLVLPVSVAMKRHENAYLQALQSFSLPMRRAWDVRWLGDEDYQFELKGDDCLYRYWDATECVVFGLRMTQEALEKDLRDETLFLQRFDQVYRAVDERYDVRGKDLTTLVLSALQNEGHVSNHRRKQFADSVPDWVFDSIEAACRDTH